MSDTKNLLQSLDYSVLQQCMHCGMCLPTCPTYDETKRERNSPRGRIALMRSVADDELEIGVEFAREMYYCLGCLACQSACPAGVQYGELFEHARAEIERQGVLDTSERRFFRWLTLKVLFMHPRLLRIVGTALWALQRSGVVAAGRKLRLTRLLPANLRRLEPRAPRVQRPFSDSRLAAIETPKSKRYRVALLTGCIQDLVYPDVNRATADVLLRNRCEVVTPRNQYCCGSLHAHNGDLESAKVLARINLEMFDLNNLDAIISNAGGCGSHLKKYGELLAEDPKYSVQATEWDHKLKDIHEWLAEIGFVPPRTGPFEKPTRVTYDASCHLCHGQGIVHPPLALLKQVPDMTLVDLHEADWCCGSAGIYSITQPEQAEKLLRRKISYINETQAEVVVTGNPGCQLQLEAGIREYADLPSCRVMHTMSLLAAAYGREDQIN